MHWLVLVIQSILFKLTFLYKLSVFKEYGSEIVNSLMIAMTLSDSTRMIAIEKTIDPIQTKEIHNGERDIFHKILERFNIYLMVLPIIYLLISKSLNWSLYSSLIVILSTIILLPSGLFSSFISLYDSKKAIFFRNATVTLAMILHIILVKIFSIYIPYALILGNIITITLATIYFFANYNNINFNYQLNLLSFFKNINSVTKLIISNMLFSIFEMRRVFAAQILSFEYHILQVQHQIICSGMGLYYILLTPYLNISFNSLNTIKPNSIYKIFFESLLIVSLNILIGISLIHYCNYLFSFYSINTELQPFFRNSIYLSIPWLFLSFLGFFIRYIRISMRESLMLFFTPIIKIIIFFASLIIMKGFISHPLIIINLADIVSELGALIIEVINLLFYTFISNNRDSKDKVLSQ